MSHQKRWSLFLVVVYVALSLFSFFPLLLHMEACAHGENKVGTVSEIRLSITQHESETSVEPFARQLFLVSSCERVGGCTEVHHWYAAGV
jgi:hypothetical protein